jgi:hypothetical protein
MTIARAGAARDAGAAQPRLIAPTDPRPVPTHRPGTLPGQEREDQIER